MELISYAMDFTSFLIQNLKDDEKTKIKSIILFGSASRGEAEEKSDVDIFIDLIIGDIKLKNKISIIKDKFFESTKFKNYWKNFGIKNEINIISGRLNEWKLKDSMLGSSIVLYQKFSQKLENGKNMALLSWGVIKNNSKRVMLNKNLFGYNYYGKLYKGALEIYNCKKIGSNVILIPIENLDAFLKIFRKFKISVKIRRLAEYPE